MEEKLAEAYKDKIVGIVSNVRQSDTSLLYLLCTLFLVPHILSS